MRRVTSSPVWWRHTSWQLGEARSGLPRLPRPTVVASRFRASGLWAQLSDNRRWWLRSLAWAPSHSRLLPNRKPRVKTGIAPRARSARIALAGLSGLALAIYACSDVPTVPRGQAAESVVVKWDQAALAAVRRTHLGPPMVARALAVAHTAMYDAWAAYDGVAVGT